MNKIKISVILLFFFANQIHAQEDSTKADIVLLKAKRYQTIESIGGNYCQARYSDHAGDQVGEFMLETLDQNNVRFALPLKKWEPENDNEHSNSINLSNFEYSEVMISLFEMLKTMKEDYGVKSFTASVWDGPTWMIANPEKRQQRKIAPEMYAETLESVAAFMLVAREEYGVEIDYFSFNEATGGYQIIFSAEEIINFIKQGGPYFQKFGFKTKFYVADAHSTKTLVDYAKPILATEEIHPYLGPVCYHSWWSDNLPDEAFMEIAELANQYNKPVWCTELGYDAMLYKKEGNPYATWENGWRLAKVTHRVLKHSQATVTHYWTYQNNFPLLRDPESPFPAYFAMKQYTDYLPSGSTLVEASSSNDKIWAMAAVRDMNYTMVNLLNTANHPVEVTLDNLPTQNFFWVITDKNGNMKHGEEQKPDTGKFTVTLAPQSINTFTTQLTVDDEYRTNR